MSAINKTVLQRIFSVCVLLSFNCARSQSSVTLPEIDGNIFYYFGYGSNLLAARLHIQNPTAQRIGLGLLKDYRLDFSGYGTRWDGAPATIVPTPAAEVYGALWEIDLSNLDDIDDQEGVHLGLYRPISVPVARANDSIIIARTYHLVSQPTSELKHLEWATIPEDRQPSKTYLQCLVKGATETGIPTPYIDWLKSVKHNGRTSTSFEEVLQLKDVQLNT